MKYCIALVVITFGFWGHAQTQKNLPVTVLLGNSYDSYDKFLADLSRLGIVPRESKLAIESFLTKQGMDTHKKVATGILSGSRVRWKTISLEILADGSVKTENGEILRSLQSEPFDLSFLRVFKALNRSSHSASLGILPKAEATVLTSIEDKAAAALDISFSWVHEKAEDVACKPGAALLALHYKALQDHKEHLDVTCGPEGSYQIITAAEPYDAVYNQTLAMLKAKGQITGKSATDSWCTVVAYLVTNFTDLDQKNTGAVSTDILQKCFSSQTIPSCDSARKNPDLVKSCMKSNYKSVENAIEAIRNISAPASAVHTVN